MDKVFSVYLYNEKHYTHSAELSLPATPYQMLDALDKVRLQDGAKLCVEVEAPGDISCLEHHLDISDVNGLNVLAQRFSTMDDHEMTCFVGLVRMDMAKAEGNIPLSRLIDLAYNVDCCTFVPGILEDEQLGRNYADNDLIPEVKDVPVNAYKFMDFEQLGRKAREQDGGVFVSPHGNRTGGYVALDGEIREVYKTLDTAPRKPDYTILVELALHGRATQLKLPAEVWEIDDALDRIETMTWSGVTIRGLDCAAPALIPHFKAEDNIAFINRLAKKIQRMELKELTKYKAVLDATENYSVLGATHIADTLRDYIYEPKYADPVDMAKDFLENSMGVAAVSLEPFVNLMGYGQRLLEEQQGAITDYGMVSREDGQSLKTSLTPTAPIQRGMEGMTM